MAWNFGNNWKVSTISIPRLVDSELLRRLDLIIKDTSLRLEKASINFLFNDQTIELSPEELRGAPLTDILRLETIVIWRIRYQFKGGYSIAIDRPCERNELKGNQDSISVHPPGNADPATVVTLVKLVRTHFNPIDEKAFFDFLQDDAKVFYRSKEANLNELQRMQQEFFTRMQEFTLDQQKKQHEFQRSLEHQHTEKQLKLDEQYALRQKQQDDQHQTRQADLDEREAGLRKLRAEIDDRNNQQARRKIYEDIKQKIVQRLLKQECTPETQAKRSFVFWFSVGLLGFFALGFMICFYLNVLSSQTSVNWPAIGSQIAFFAMLVGVATFLIRWNHSWFQKHADEEFKLKRLDLDIDRASWLVELALEWKNMVKDEMPPELIEKLARSLFTSEDGKDIDIHPLETLLSSMAGKDGRFTLDLSGKLAAKRKDGATNSKREDER